MAVNGFDQLTRLAKTRRYREAAQSVAAVRQLSAFFRSYTAVERVATLYRGVQEVQAVLRTQANADFRALYVRPHLPLILGSIDDETAPRAQRNSQLNDICAVIDAMDEDARRELVTWFCDAQLREYRRIFKPSEEVTLDCKTG